MFKIQLGMKCINCIINIPLFYGYTTADLNCHFKSEISQSKDLNRLLRSVSSLNETVIWQSLLLNVVR